jgi:hypothetical protein
VQRSKEDNELDAWCFEDEGNFEEVRHREKNPFIEKYDT